MKPTSPPYRIFALIVLTTFTVLAMGCKELKEPQLLDSSHTGWKSQHCEQCHELPVPNHTAAIVTECAVCHGGNGACDPNAPGVGIAHDNLDDCIACHDARHGFEEDIDCAACHFAESGVVDCTDSDLPDNATEPEDDNSTDDEETDNETLPEEDDETGGPELAGGLTGSCFGWPEEEFSLTNKADLTTALQSGQLAVGFTLKDPTGQAYSLSELLKTRPVLMVFGAFT